MSVNVSAALGAAINLLQTGKLKEAEEQCLVALRLEPANISAKHTYSVVLTNQGRASEVLPALEDLAQRPDAPPRIHYDLAVARAECGLFDAAMSGLRHAATLPVQIPQSQQLLQYLQTQPYMPATALQGVVPRQAYMAAAVYLKRDIKRPLRILEIGSYMGASAITWGASVAALTENTAELTCVDPWEGASVEQYDGGMGEKLREGIAYRVFLNSLRFLPGRVTVKHVIGFSRDVLPTLREKFDLIYVDGCHLYAEMSADLKCSHELLEEDGLICGDDLELQMAEIDEAAARSNLRVDYIQDPKTGQHFHPGVTLAVGETYGPVSVYRGFWIMQRRAGTYSEVSLAGAVGLVPRHWPANFQQFTREAVAADNILSRLI